MLHPNSLFHRYRERIAGLDKIERDSILCGDFALQQDTDLQIYYAPHNEFIHPGARIVIVGITPGWSQTQRAYQTAKNGIAQQLKDEEICFRCKMDSRFAGTMRTNLIAMLNELGLHTRLGLSSCAELFRPENDILHTTSLIKYPCFYKGKNYSGHTPAIGSSEILRKYIRTEFMEELNCLDAVRLIIPLGAAVEGIFRETGVLSSLHPCAVLWGFPHPSGLNARRTEQFQTNRESMVNIIRNLDFCQRCVIDDERSVR